MGNRSRLTNRELEVLSLLSEGNSNKVLATLLAVSPRTIQKHLQRIYAKLGVVGRTPAILHFIKTRNL